MPDAVEMQIEANAAAEYAEMQESYGRVLVAPRDDMWATFADRAQPYALKVRDLLVGIASVNESRELMAFHVRPEWQHLAEDWFGELVDEFSLIAALPSTVDPAFLSVCLPRGRSWESRALLYQHACAPEGDPLAEIRAATAEEHEAAIAFAEMAVGMPRSFLEGYYGERINKRELYLHRVGDEILAVGECRTDERSAGYAHLGMIVSPAQRGRGLGRGLLHALVVEAQARGLEPRCSTEPDNVPAQRAIHRAGFRTMHRVFRVSLTTSE